MCRSVEEWLVKVATHDHGNQVQGSGARTEGEVSLRVADNGAGFQITAPRKAGSLGLAGLRERAQLLKGTVNIDSTPGQGTVVVVHIPVQQGDSA